MKSVLVVLVTLLAVYFFEHDRIRKTQVLANEVKKLSSELQNREKVSADEFSTRAELNHFLKMSEVGLASFPDIAKIINPSKNSGLDLATMIRRRVDILNAIPNIMPTEGWIASGFGKRDHPFKGEERDHKGIDISNLDGTPIYAPADGIVRYAGKNGSFGMYLSITHGVGIVTKYGHVGQLAIKSGTKVKRGDLIAFMGNSGKSTGTHLHYEVWVNDKPKDPAGFMPQIHKTPRLLVDSGFRD